MNKLKVRLYGGIIVFVATIHPLVDHVIYSAILLFLFAILITKNRWKLPHASMTLIAPLSLILLLGLLNGVLKYPAADFLKDVYLHGRPIIVILFAVALGGGAKLGGNEYIKYLVMSGLISSFIHFVEIISIPGFINMSVQELRVHTNLSSWIEVLALGVILFAKGKVSEIGGWLQKYRMIFIVVLLISIFMYGSRSMLLNFLLIFVFLNHNLLTGRNFLYFLVACFLVAGFLLSPNVKNSESSIGRFYEKLEKSKDELFATGELTKAEINTQWRGYEAREAIEQTVASGYYAIFMGSGYGSLLDLGMYQKLGDEDFRYIPKIHNGFVQLFFKVGIVGVVIYVYFLYSLSAAISRVNDPVVVRICRSQVAALFLSTFTISGVYNYITVDLVVIFIILSIYMSSSKVRV